jgi:cathepsin F
VANFTAVRAANGDEAQLRAALVHRGPLAVALNAVFMQTYVGGVSCPLVCPAPWSTTECCSSGTALRLRSAAARGPALLGHQELVGKQWGEQGYYRLCRGRGMCGVDTMISAVAVQPLS